MPTIAQILVATGRGFVSDPVEQAMLRLGGLDGDRHVGLTRPSCARTPWHKRGTPIANTRQISILSVEECAAIAERLAVPAVDPRLLGANLVIADCPRLSALPAATRMQFPSGATLFITEENVPCRGPGAQLAKAHERPRLEVEFPRAAIGRRGLVALVEREGEIRIGDAVRLIVPRPRGEN